MTVAITPLATYRNETPYPFCPGCGHGVILNHLNEALVKLEVDPRKVVLVSDIGCSGLSDQYFATSAFHGLHGRSITYASGIKLARPELTVIVIMGDGGTGIGGAHLLNAARRNVGITVLVFNNFNFGMTGGQHSTTTPAGADTSTTPLGNLESPLDICATVAANGAAYVYRGTSFDKDLADRMADGVKQGGFALLDIWELCTAYYVPRNEFSRKELFKTLEELKLPTGVLRREETEGYETAYRREYADIRGKPTLTVEPLESCFSSSLRGRFRLVVAGAAGGKVRSAVRLAGRAAILSGLRAAQREDYPVTVQSGHSLSELVLNSESFHYTGVVRPDALLLLAPEGLKKALPYLAAMAPEDRVFALPELADVETRAALRVVDPKEAPVRLTRQNRSLVALAAILRALDLVSLEALREAVRRGPSKLRGEKLEAIEAGWRLEIPAGKRERGPAA
jgi:pyruvate/2-oxoacid:ferredoxin oxidoreductase beta subunit/Pyruvate/2-oxoacid:ferredoxin oxidoreductase gamma subunit